MAVETHGIRPQRVLRHPGLRFLFMRTLATLVVVALAMAGRGRIARPSALLLPVSTHPVVRVLVVLGWMWVGWHFFAR